MNREPDMNDLDAAELEEQREAQAARHRADYGNCDPAGAELLAAYRLAERFARRED